MTLPILAIVTDDEVLCPTCEKKADPDGSRYRVTTMETPDFYSPTGRMVCMRCSRDLFRCKRPGDVYRAREPRGRSAR